ncbi:MAG TPA: hypothetical protein VEY69_03395, partial [Lautropia sp.]|nr:hypothetical protein [Lautropia sp.]
MGPASRLGYSLARPALFALDAERAHELTLSAVDRLAGIPLFDALGARLLGGPPVSDPFELMGLRFPNRVGLAAGLDKDARHIDGLALLGFGFLELGTVTPLAQPGNPRPRLFRLPAADALINRFGFNNRGIERFVDSVRRSRTWQRTRGPTSTRESRAAPRPASCLASAAAFSNASSCDHGPIIGLNIGKNASTPMERATDDYLTCLRHAMPVADYVTINISSPNTSNLRQLQAGRELELLLAALDNERARLVAAGMRDVPLLVKIAPDLD